MPITWYVTRGAVAAATDSFEAYGVSVMVGRSELSEAVSIGGELLVANLAVGVSVMVGRSELSEAVSIGGELLVVNLAVAGIGDAATDEVFG
jgi:hypothetical protein